MKKALFFLSVLLLLSTSVVYSKESKRSFLHNDTIRSIVHRFVFLHYAHQPLDDAMSKKIFNLYLNRLDPGHYYFLEKDITEFRKMENRMDDMLLRGDSRIALDMFERFKTRLSERLASLEEFSKEEFDFKKDGTWQIDRKTAAYPKTKKDARKLWRLKIKFDLLNLKIAGNTIKEGKDRLLKRVRGQWKNYAQYTDDNVVALYLNALTRAYDPHSTYMEPQDFKNFDIAIKLSLEGIGAVLRWEDGYTVVSSIVPGGAAFKNGRLKVDDRIIAVAQAEQPFESVIDLRLNDVVQLIRGKRGTKVRLQILRKTKSGLETISFGIVRDKIILKDGEAHSRVVGPSQKDTVPEEEKDKLPKEFRIGIIDLPSFYIDFNDRRKHPQNYKSSSRDVKHLLQKFLKEDVDGVILDLRGNGGGGLDEAIKMGGLFTGAGPIVIVEQTGENRVRVHQSRKAKIYSGPLLVMVDRYSASASEILAGAMKDYDRAILVGDTTTFGKGTVQNIVNLSRETGALKITIAQFYRVSGASTQNKGVKTHITLPSLNNVRKVGESTLENALPWKAIDPALYRTAGNVSAYVSELKKRSEARVKKNENYQKLKVNIKEYQEKVEPLKFTSILKMQENYEKQKAKQDQEIASATKAKKNGEAGSKTTATASDNASVHKQAAKSGQEIRLDEPLKEGIAIMEDYIRMLNAKPESQTQRKAL